MRVNQESKMDVFSNNLVPIDYQTRIVARNLSPYNTPANKRILLGIFEDFNLVEIVNGLMLWLGSKTAKGYPRINSKRFPDRPVDDDGKQLPLHRLVYELIKKHAPVNACICRKSNIRHCISPSDLFEGTYSNNSIHVIMSNRRKYPKGEKHWNAKVYSTDISDIVHLYYANAMPVYKIAERFGLIVGHTSKDIHGHERTEESRIAREEE